MYFVALENVSRYALNEAVKSCSRGGHGHEFFPNTVELRRECDKAMEPHIRQAAHARNVARLVRDRDEFDRVLASRTPEAKARVSAVYAEFCEQHRPDKPEVGEEAVFLDPELVAKVPDAPTAFKRASVA